MNDLFYIIIFLGILLLLAIPLGGYMASVFTGRRTLMSFLLRPIELGIYRLCRVDENQEMSWKEYSFCIYSFQRNWSLCIVHVAAHTGVVAAQSHGLRSRPMGHRLKYGHIICNQHKLAGLWWRDNNELSDPNDGDDGTKLCIGCHRDSGCVAPDSCIYL